MAMQAWMMAMLVACACGGMAGVRAQTVETPTFVFVGELESIAEIPDPCVEASRKAGELTCINLDALYRARYRVVEPLVGSHGGDTLEFRIADHYGFPSFARFRHALLFVAMADDGPWLHKYQAVPVHRTVAGQWAACGDITRRSDQPPSPYLKPLRFEGAIARWRDLSESMQYSYRAGDMPHWRVERGQVFCSEGIELEDVYAIVRDGVMQARGVPLPDLPVRPAEGAR